MRRVAAIWGRPVIPVEKGGAALGAAAAGAYAFFKSTGEETDIETFCAALLKRGRKIKPRQEDVSAVHNPGGYLDRFAAAEAALIAEYPTV
jgi:sugar (pentulose or hexulose) kinase